ncbi:MAG: mechanosensitive ion channel [Lentisphaerae bacterium]|nr:mechanosensitive ion channel [Lentisphaerota bacterium]
MKALPKRLAVPVLAAALGLLPLAASAQEGPAASSLSRLEPGLMLLTALCIFVFGGALLRMLIRLRVARHIAWLLPILIALCALFLAGLRLTVYPELPRLRALVRFLLVFFAFVSVLYPAAKLLLPSSAQLTRGGVPPLIRGLIVAVIAFAGLFVLLTWSFPGLSLTPMFVTSGAVSIVVGLAVQDLLANLLAGVVISFERPFKVGDWIRIGETEGEVAEITWRATRIRTRQNDYLLVPNTVTTKEHVTNYDQPSALHLLKICVGVTYETPCALAVHALIEAAARVEDVLTSPAPEAHFREFADSALVYELRAWIDNYESVPAIGSDLRQAIWYSFKRHGITIPFPQRDVHMIPVPEAPAGRYARLLITGGPLRGALFELGDAKLTIGRDPASDMCISDPHVSAAHGEIAPRGGAYVLRDLQSRHGIRVNGEKAEEVVLRQGDHIEIGPIAFVYEENAGPRGVRGLKHPFMGGSLRTEPPPPPPPDAGGSAALETRA